MQPDVIHFSVITLAEIRKGVVRIRSRDPQQAAHLEQWRARLEAEYVARASLLPVDALVGQVWGDLQGERAIPILDGFLAATALVHELTLAIPGVEPAAVRGEVAIGVSSKFGPVCRESAG